MTVLFEIFHVRIYICICYATARLSTCCGSVILIVELGENWFLEREGDISSMLSRNKYCIETKEFPV